MNCPNDRYVNDADICQAMAAMLARIGVKINLMAETKVTYFPKILSRTTSFYMLGWTPGSYDAHNAIFALLMSPGEHGQGQFNLGSRLWHGRQKRTSSWCSWLTTTTG